VIPIEMFSLAATDWLLPSRNTGRDVQETVAMLLSRVPLLPYWKLSGPAYPELGV